MPVGKNEIENRFGNHGSTNETNVKHERLRAGYIAFANFLDEVLPDSRAKSMAQTKLQESSMWANYCADELAPVVMDPS